MTYDLIIIGKGPAGISAALYAARAGFGVLVIGKGRGALERAESIENYYGFAEPVSGAALADAGVAQALRLGVSVLDEEAVGLSFEDEFVVRTTGSEFRSRVLLLATGKSRVQLKVPGFEEFRGKGIGFCVVCDGFFYRGKKVALVGAGDYAASEYHELTAFTKDITVFTDGVEVPADRFPGARIVTGKIEGFEGADRVAAVRSAGVSHPVDGVFVAVGTAGAADFAAKIGVISNGTDIAVDADFMTNVPGLYAAGDCIGGFLQVAKAVSDGALAAKAIVARLKNSPRG